MLNISVRQAFLDPFFISNFKFFKINRHLFFLFFLVYIGKIKYYPAISPARELEAQIS